MRLRPVRTAILLLAAPALGACSQFGIPDFPPELHAPEQSEGALFVVYDPHAVLGFGHTGLIVARPDSPHFDRYDQYASTEIEYAQRAADGEAGFGEGFFARLPPFAGGTREFVTRHAAESPGALMGAHEFAVPVPAAPEAVAAIHSAAEARFHTAAVLESPQARRYYIFHNNCQHFVLDLLDAGGLDADDFFPKHLMETYLAAYRERGAAPEP
jgi:hypothetical protein